MLRLLAAVAFLSLQTTDGASFEKALLEDMLPASSGRCSNDGQKTSTTFSFPGTDSASQWHSPFVNLEPELFLAQMKHEDQDKNRTWSMRIGEGGNPYSFIGAFGEAMPPQNHNAAPWIDEVWQMVAVDQSKNNNPEPYFIHQAGTYQREETLKQKPFYSPNVAGHCSGEEGTCSFVSWGQHAHVPTQYTSSNLYYTRYTDCGDGVVEVTWMMYNMGGSADGKVTDDKWSYLNVPWGGVRTSILRDVVWERAGKTELLSPLAGWGTSGQVLKDLRDFGGYTAFAQQLPRPVKPVDVPAGLMLVRGGSCIESAHHSSSHGRLTLRMVLQPTVEVKTGSNQAMTFVNGQGQGMTLGGVLHWSWATKYLYFWPEEQDSATAVTQCNALFKNGDTLTVTSAAEPSKPEQDNLGLAFVHGSEASTSFEGDAGWQNHRRQCRVRMGGTNAARDFTVWTINAFNQVPAGASYSYRQSVIVDSFTTLQDRAKDWATEAKQRYVSNHNAASSITPGRPIALFDVGERNFGVKATAHALTKDQPACGSGALRCQGRTTPHGTARALFAVQCGTEHYLGFDQYHFEAPVPAGGTGARRPYAHCGTDANGLPIRPSWKLLGFFESGACDSLGVDAVLDVDACDSTTSPTKNPTGTPTNVPTKAPTPKPTDAPTAAPTTGAPTAGATGYCSFNGCPGVPQGSDWCNSAVGNCWQCAASAQWCHTVPTPVAAPGVTPTPFPSKPPTPEPTNPPLPAFKADDPKFDKTKMDVADVISFATMAPTKYPTQMPTSPGYNVIQDIKQVPVIIASIAFPVTETQLANEVIEHALTTGVAAALGIPSDKVKITSINGVEVDFTHGFRRRRLAPAVDDMEVTFEIQSETDQSADVQELQNNIVAAAASGAIVANVQKVASDSGVLTQALLDMPRALAAPTLHVDTTTVVTQMEVRVTEAPTNSPTKPPTFPPTTATTFGGATTRMVRTRGGATTALREGSDFTTTCSHVRCASTHDVAMREGVPVNRKIVEVHHHHAEHYGNKHICKDSLHTKDKCGCECFDEGFDLLTELTADMMDQRAKGLGKSEFDHSSP